MSEDPLRPDPRGRGSLPLRAFKANQPDLLEDVRLLFDEPPPGERFLTARQVDQHGGRLEVRQLRASATLAAYLREAVWEAAGLVLEVETTVRWPAHPARPARHQVCYFLTSLPAHTRRAEARRATRRHWHIENRLHWPRDVTLGEEACQVRTDRAPANLAACRNAALNLLRRAGVTNVAAALRRRAMYSRHAVALMGVKLA